MASSVLDSLVQSAVVSVLQGSADAFATSQLATGISTAARYGWMIQSIDFAWSAGIVATPQTADADAIIQITQGSTKAALVSPVDVDLVAEWRQCFPGIAAAVNAYQLPIQFRWQAPENLVIVDPVLNLLVDSTLTGVANTGYAKIWYYPVPISELDILRMIALR